MALDDEGFFGSYPSGDATAGMNRRDEAKGLARLIEEYRLRWVLSVNEAERDVLQEVRAR